jgi:hypothetical protein
VSAALVLGSQTTYSQSDHLFAGDTPAATVWMSQMTTKFLRLEASGDLGNEVTTIPTMSIPSYSQFIHKFSLDLGVSSYV